MSIPCGVCGAATTLTLALNQPYTARLCPTCDSLTTEIPNRREPADATNETLYLPEERAPIYARRRLEFRARYAITLRLIRKYIPRSTNPKLLEVGSNIGVFTHFAQNHGFEVDSIEINELCRQYQIRTYNVPAVRSIDDLDPTRTYDAIVMMDVLEHVTQPIDLLARAAARLAPNGVLFIQFPNWRSLVAQTAGTRWPWWAAPDHRFHFSPKFATEVLPLAGLRALLSRTVALPLDDLAALPALRLAAPAARRLNELVPLNIFLPHPRGSLIQTLARRVPGSERRLRTGTHE